MSHAWYSSLLQVRSALSRLRGLRVNVTLKAVCSMVRGGNMDPGLPACMRRSRLRLRRRRWRMWRWRWTWKRRRSPSAWSRTMSGLPPQACACSTGSRTTPPSLQCHLSQVRALVGEGGAGCGALVHVGCVVFVHLKRTPVWWIGVSLGNAWWRAQDAVCTQACVL